MSNEREQLFPSRPRRPLPRRRLLRFFRLAQLNYRTGVRLSVAVRVAWADARRDTPDMSGGS